MAYLTDLAPRPDRDHLADACPAHHQRPGEHVGQVIATRPAAFERGDVNTGNLAHRCGLTRQQRFIGLQVVALNEDRIGWHPVSLCQHDEIATHDLPAGDAFAFAIANDQSTRTGEIA